MNTQNLIKALRRLSAIGLLLAVVLAPVVLVVQPVYFAMTDRQEQIARERTLLGRLEAASRDEGMATELDKRTTAMRTTGLFLEGDSEAVRVASLQTLVMSIATANNVKPRSLRTLVARERNEMRWVGVQVQLAAQTDQLRSILMSLEDQQRFLLIDGLHIAPLPAAGSGTEEQGLVDVRFDVFGVEKRVK